MSDLIEHYKKVREHILADGVYAMPSLCTINALPEISRRVNGSISADFNPDNLRKAGIDPKEFRETQAINYAKKTLRLSNNPGAPFDDVLRTRLNTCLDESDEWSFGRFLSENLKRLAERKLEINAPLRRTAAPGPAP